VDPYAGLPAATRAYLSTFSGDTQKGADWIRSAYNSVAQDARTDNAAAQNQIASLAALAGAGYTPGGVQEQAARQQASTLAALSTSSASRFPTTIESAGAGAGAAYTLGRAGQRAQFITDDRAQQLEIDKVQADVNAKQRELAAQLRGQNLNLLAAKISAGGALTRAELAANTSLANNQLDAQVSQSNAALAANTSLANTQARVAATQAAQDKKARQKARQHQLNTRKLASQARRTVNQMVHGVPNPSYDPNDPSKGPKTLSFTTDDIIDALIEQYKFSPELAAKYAEKGAVSAVRGWF
jgi:hypothetical protein